MSCFNHIDYTSPLYLAPSVAIISYTSLSLIKKGDVREVDLMDDQSKEEDRLMWLVWPFQVTLFLEVFERWRRRGG